MRGGGEQDGADSAAANESLEVAECQAYLGHFLSVTGSYSCFDPKESYQRAELGVQLLEGAKETVLRTLGSTRNHELSATVLNYAALARHDMASRLANSGLGSATVAPERAIELLGYAEDLMVRSLLMREALYTTLASDGRRVCTDVRLGESWKNLATIRKTGAYIWLRKDPLLLSSPLPTEEHVANIERAQAKILEAMAAFCRAKEAGEDMRKNLIPAKTIFQALELFLSPSNKNRGKHPVSQWLLVELWTRLERARAVGGSSQRAEVSARMLQVAWAHAESDPDCCADLQRMRADVARFREQQSAGELPPATDPPLTD